MTRADHLLKRARKTASMTLATRRAIAAAILAPLRESPEQWSACQAIKTCTLLAITAQRRSGKSEVIFRYALAACIANTGYVVRFLTTVLSAPTENFFGRHGRDNLQTLIERFNLGAYVRVYMAQGSVKAIVFAWGSAIHVHDVANTRAINAKRGFFAHLYIADEAQSMVLLAVVLLDLVFPTLVDARGHIVLAGTPGPELDGLFYSATHGDDGWSVARLASYKNPSFGTSFEDRWQRIINAFVVPAAKTYRLSAGDILRLRALSEAELDALADGTAATELREWVATLHASLQREVLGLWTRDANRYVFSWHRVAPEQRYWCQQSVPLEHRFAMLPTIDYQGSPIPHAWSAVVGVDIGYSPDPLALVAIVSAPTCDRAFVLYTETHYELGDTEAFEAVVAFCDRVQRCGFAIRSVRADLTGMRKGTLVDWDRKLRVRLPRQVPMQAPAKHDKPGRTKALNLDIEAGRLIFVEGDPLDIEGAHLQYKPFDAEHPKNPEIDKYREVHLDDGTVLMPGDHCLDALRYAAADVEVLFTQLVDVIRAPTAEDQVREMGTALRRRALQGAA